MSWGAAHDSLSRVGDPVPFAEGPELVLPSRGTNTNREGESEHLFLGSTPGEGVGLQPGPDLPRPRPPPKDSCGMNTCTGPEQRSMAKPQGPGKQPRPSGKPATLLSSAGPTGSTRGSPGPSVSRVGGAAGVPLPEAWERQRSPPPSLRSGEGARFSLQRSPETQTSSHGLGFISLTCSGPVCSGAEWCVRL